MAATEFLEEGAPEYLVQSVLLQRVRGRTGGGPPCPCCGKRALYRMQNDDRLHCRECHIGARVVVKDGGIVVEAL